MSKEFIYFDGDQFLSQHVDWRNISTNDISLRKLKDIVFNQTNCNVEFHVDGTNGRSNEKQKLDLYKKYLDYYKSNVFYLPGNIPEDIIWDKITAEKLLLTIYDQQNSTNFIYEISVMDNSKNKFAKLSLLLYGEDNTNSDMIFNLQKLFIQSWIKKGNEHYHAIVETINKIASL